MLVPINIKSHSCLALGIPGINSRADVRMLRNALLEMLDACLTDEEQKDITSSRALHTVLSVIYELTKDLEDKEKGERV